jgi:predicted nucleotidyltransferase
MARKKNQINLIKSKLEEYIKVLTKTINVDQMILFGSYAKGEAHEFSDIDIALISSELNPRKPTFVHNIEIKEKANYYDPDLQLFAFPKEKFEKEEGIQREFIREIKKTGKVIYQRPAS